MTEAAVWVRRVAASARPVLVAYPLSFDWTWLYWYFVRFSTVGSPFNHSSCFDIKTAFAVKGRLPVAAAGRSGLYETLKPKHEHTHHAVDDAIEQAQISPTYLSGTAAMGEILNRRRQSLEERLTALDGRLNPAKRFAGDHGCVYLTGSFARGEAGEHSDLDVFIIGSTDESRERRLRRLDERCVKAELIKGSNDAGFPEFSGDGEYLVHHTVHDLVDKLGMPDDDSQNTFTARMLLLLESRPTVGRGWHALWLKPHRSETFLVLQ